MNLKTERRCCLTGTPVQNRLDDLFTLTEFLRFHPVENRSNARRWILDPLGMKEEHALDQFRLLMGAVALRRSRLSENIHGRSEKEVSVTLSRAEREHYASIRTRARRTITRSGKNSSSHTLISYILQMRQVCSHGLSGQISRPGILATRQYQRGQYVCDRCAEVFYPSPLSKLTSIATDGPQYCLECAFEEDGSLDLAPDSESLQNDAYEDSSPPISWVDNGMTDSMADDTAGQDIDMDMDESLTPGGECSSKIDSIMRNLVLLEQDQHRDNTPIKR